MEAYRLEAIVQENGVVEIPETSQLADQEVEIRVTPKPTAQNKASPDRDVAQFLIKWRGLLKGMPPDELKWRYS